MGLEKSQVAEYRTVQSSSKTLDSSWDLYLVSDWFVDSRLYLAAMVKPHALGVEYSGRWFGRCDRWEVVLPSPKVSPTVQISGVLRRQFAQ